MESFEAETAHDQITALIRAGVFQPGEVLRAARLAEMIGQSRTPVREALTRLAGEGIVELRANRGARLISLSAEDVSEIFSLRSVHESQAAALAAINATPRDISEMREILDALEATDSPARGDRQGPSTLNAAFHMAIVRAARSPLLEAAYVRANREALLTQQVFLGAFDLTRQTYQHRDVLDAIAHGNPEWARAAMFNHAETTRETLVLPSLRPVPDATDPAADLH